MTTFRIASWIAFAAGALEIFMGIRHFPLAYAMAKAPEFACLSQTATDLFILLWLCVGLLLITFGLLSLFFAHRLNQADPAARIFFLCQGIMLGVRAVFERIYPVSIPSPDPSVMVKVVVLSLCFLTPVALVMWKGKGGDRKA